MNTDLSCPSCHDHASHLELKISETGEASVFYCPNCSAKFHQRVQTGQLVPCSDSPVPPAPSFSDSLGPIRSHKLCCVNGCPYDKTAGYVVCERHMNHDFTEQDWCRNCHTQTLLVSGNIIRCTTCNFQQSYIAPPVRSKPYIDSMPPGEEDGSNEPASPAGFYNMPIGFMHDDDWTQDEVDAYIAYCRPHDGTMRHPLPPEEWRKYRLAPLDHRFNGPVSPEIREQLQKEWAELYQTSGKPFLAAFQADGHPPQVEIVPGALSTPGLDYSLVPPLVWEELVQRFMLGEERKGPKAWNAKSANQHILSSRKFILNRISHAIQHLLNFQQKIISEADLSTSDNDPAALLWAGAFLSCARRALIDDQKTKGTP